MTRTRSDLRKVVRLGTLVLGALSLTFLTGCQWFSQTFALDGPMSTRVTDGPVARSQWDLFMITVWVCTFIFIIVGAVLAYAQIKFRAKNEADDHAEPPPQGHGNPLIEIGLIVASVALLVIIAIPTLKGIWYTSDVPEEERGNAMDVTAVGYQWWFRFEYNGEKVQLPGGGEAPLVTGNELVVPVDVPVRVHLRTVDVIHSFWVPKLAGKVDMIPNRPNYLWFKADKPGYFYGQCAEYCGESHAIMRFRVIALSAADYVKWLENQKNGARTATAAAINAEANKVTMKFASLQTDVSRDTQPGSTLAASPKFDADPLAAWKAKQQAAPDENAGLVAQGRKLFQEKTCINCHSVRGHEGIGINGPDLTHVGSRTTIAAGVLENTPERMAQWLKDPNYFKPGNKMTYGLGGMAGYLKMDEKSGEWVPNIQLNDQEIEALVSYLQSLK